MLSPDQERTYSTRDDLLLFNLVPQPVWVFDIVKRQMWFANTEAIELWSAKSLDDLLARNFSDDMSEATARRLDDSLVKLRKGEHIKDQWTFYPNGQGPKTVETIALGIHIEEGRMAMLVHGVIKDVSTETEQKGLRAVEMLRHLPVAVCQFDIEGHLMEQNPEALAAFGNNNSQPSQRKRRQGRSLVTPNDSPLDNISLSSSSSDESTVTDIDDDDDDEEEDVFDVPVSQFVSHFVDQNLGRQVLEDVKNGKDCSLEALQHTLHGPRWSSVRVRKTKDPVTTEPVLLYSARDITQVIDAKEQAEKANIAKSDFFAMMAYEVRTPLHHVVNVIELVSKSCASLTKAESTFKTLLDSSAKLLMTVINDLFDSLDGTKDKVTLEDSTFRLDDVVNHAMTLVMPKAKHKGLQLRVGLSSRLGKMDFVGDQNRVNQVLFNLLQNAVKYTQYGSVDLSIKRHLRTRSRRTWIRFEVKDTGIGISLQQRQRLLEKRPLLFLDKEGGVGLSMCKAVVDSMGGRIGVESYTGQGSTFWFELPFRRKGTTSGSHHVEDSVTTLESVPDEGGLRILLVDDDETNCRIMTAMLQKLGNVVESCSDGQEMVKRVQTNAFDVVLVEIQLPGLSGLEATRQVRALGYSREALPILALTSVAPRTDFLEVGLNDWLTKPLLMKDIKAAMTNAICNCGSSAGTSIFTGNCDETGTYTKRSITEGTADNLMSLMSSAIVEGGFSESSKDE